MLRSRSFAASMIAVSVVAIAAVSMSVTSAVDRDGSVANSPAVTTPAVDPAAVAKAEDISGAFQQVAEAIRPSVVSISSTQKAKPAANFQQRPGREQLDRLPPELRQFFGRDMFEHFKQFQTPAPNFDRQGMGTGVVISTQGHILTNNHVVRDADEVKVTLSDGHDWTAKVVGTDEKTDLAVLKIDAPNLVPARLGDSDAVKIGEWVVAVGTPFGLDQTVTAGIISAKGRNNVGITDYEDFIQTDAAINPGNSGGPLVNLRGEVIGINTAIASRTGGYMGIGFAIPINMARQIKDSLLKDGHVTRGWLGAAIQNLTPELADSFKFEGTDGVLIGDVVKDGPAERAGLKSGDIVLSIAGKPVHNVQQLRAQVAAQAPESTTKVEYFREGKRQEANVTIGVLDSKVALKGGPAAQDTLGELGLAGEALTPELASTLGYEGSQKGVVITGVEPGSLAARAGLRERDVIVSVNGNSVATLDEFKAATGEKELAAGIRLRVLRDGLGHFVVIRTSK